MTALVVVVAKVIEQPRPTAAPIPGLDHATWAGQAEGLTQISLWCQAGVGEPQIPMVILGGFGATPVATWLPDGEALELPWRT
jgi:hypothetical protein